MVRQLFRSKLFGPLVETASHRLRIMVVEAEWNAISQSVISQSVNHVSAMLFFVKTASCQVLIVSFSYSRCLLVRHIAVLEIIVEAGRHPVSKSPVLVISPLQSRL